MTTDDKIRYKKLQYDINREAAKILALSSGKLGVYEYLAGKEKLPSNQRHIIEQPKFTYSLSQKGFEKRIKTIEKQGEKQIQTLEKRIKKIFLDTD